jgi:hypothetical protein
MVQTPSYGSTSFSILRQKNIKREFSPHIMQTCYVQPFFKGFAALMFMFTYVDAFLQPHGALGIPHQARATNRRRLCSLSVVNLIAASKSATVVDKADTWLREQTL